MDTEPETTSDYGIISADDHVVEPPELWQTRLPSRYREAGPRVERRRLDADSCARLGFTDVDAGRLDAGDVWADVWCFEDVETSNAIGSAAAGIPFDQIFNSPILFDEMRPGCLRMSDRLEDMDRNGVEASMCFPNLFVRFCGQRFLHAADKDLALACVQAYNDFIVEEWCGPSGGRLVPLCIVPLWDADAATEELLRNAARGVRAVAFSELPTFLGLPSIFTGYWDRFIATAAETGTVINLHIGSGSHMATTSPDAPSSVSTLINFTTPAMALADWLTSGLLVKHPSLRLALAECNIGWLPYVLERADTRWSEGRGYQPEWNVFDRPPSEYFASNVFCSFFNDRAGLAHIAEVGVVNSFGFDNLTFETDYPHSDSTWPRSKQIADDLMRDLSEDVRRKLLHDTAARQLGLSGGVSLS